MADSVYTYGLAASDIGPRLAEADIDGDSDPDSTQVGVWITEVCAIVNTELEALGIEPAAITSSAFANQYHAIRHRVSEYVKALWLGGNQRDESEYVAADSERLGAFIADIRSIAQKVLGSLAPVRARSHVTNATLRPTPSKLRGSSRWFD